MRQLVGPHIGAIIGLEGTEVALERFLPRVDATVLREVVLQIRSVRTQSAPEPLDLRVCEHVAF